MGFAHPDHRTSRRGVGNAPFKRASAASAEDLSGERVSFQVFLVVFFDALFLRTLLDQALNVLPVLAADDGLVVVFNENRIFFTAVNVTLKGRVGPGLLEDTVSGVFLVREHAVDSGAQPSTSVSCRDAFVI